MMKSPLFKLLFLLCFASQFAFGQLVRYDTLISVLTPTNLYGFAENTKTFTFDIDQDSVMDVQFNISISLQCSSNDDKMPCLYHTCTNKRLYIASIGNNISFAGQYEPYFNGAIINWHDQGELIDSLSFSYIYSGAYMSRSITGCAAPIEIDFISPKQYMSLIYTKNNVKYFGWIKLNVMDIVGGRGVYLEKSFVSEVPAVEVVAGSTEILTGNEDEVLQSNKSKTLLRIFTPIGQEVKQEQAINGMYIYQYSDGSTSKVCKQ